jgi:hypothetical protein
MKVVATPIEVAVALGLLNPIALEDDDAKVEDGARPPDRKMSEVVLDAKFVPAD